MNIKPIETVYNGYRFRSRLEARWAVFFDSAGIKYQYEPEGFELEDGTRYLPDFYLPDQNVFVEVKPSKEKLAKDGERMSWFIDRDGPLANGLLVLGQVPVFPNNVFENIMGYSIPSDNFRNAIPRFNLFKWDDGIKLYFASFLGSKLYIQDTGICVSVPNDLGDISFGEDLYVMDDSFGQTINRCDFEINKNDEMFWRVFKQTMGCFGKARQARFEHGESGSARRAKTEIVQFHRKLTYYEERLLEYALKVMRERNINLKIDNRMLLYELKKSRGTFAEIDETIRRLANEYSSP